MSARIHDRILLGCDVNQDLAQEHDTFLAYDSASCMS